MHVCYVSWLKIILAASDLEQLSYLFVSTERAEFLETIECWLLGYARLAPELFHQLPSCSLIAAPMQFISFIMLLVLF